MGKTKIEWCDYTWNPITGCYHNCEYCYAKVFAKRFSGDVRLNCMNEQCEKVGERLFELEKPFISQNDGVLAFPFGFKPTLHKYRLKDPAKWKSGQNIFVCSMADLFGEWVPDEWIEKVFQAAKANPQHNYLFLTKNPNKYYDLFLDGKLEQGDNFWYGFSVTNNSPICYLPGHKTFISFEPLLEDLDCLSDESNRFCDWAIIGAESGNRKEKVVPKLEWIERIVCICEKFNIPVFMKDSLIPIIGEENMRREFPTELKRHEISEKNKARWVTQCAECKQTYVKKDMTAILERKARGETATALGYICDNCFEKFRRKFKNER